MGNKIDTPYLKVDIDILNNNIERMAQIAKKNKVDLRPHIKTHKTSKIAKKQLEAGAIGISVAKVGEAEVMANQGIDDILIAYPVIGINQLRRAADLAQKIKLRIGVDSIIGAQRISEIGEEKNIEFKTLLIVDSGYERCGVKPNKQGIKIAKEIDSFPHLSIDGIFTHEGQSSINGPIKTIKKMAKDIGKSLVNFANQLRKNKIDAKIVSPGATPSAFYIPEVEGITEIRPGSYVFNDTDNAKMGKMNIISLDDCALSVCATVISKPTNKKIIIDAGSKSLTVEKGLPSKDSIFSGYGFIKYIEGAILNRVTEEHGVVEFSKQCKLNIGDKIEIIPNHVCTVVNLFDCLYIFQGEQFLNKWEIEARGRVQ